MDDTRAPQKCILTQCPPQICHSTDIMGNANREQFVFHNLTKKNNNILMQCWGGHIADKETWDHCSKAWILTYCSSWERKNLCNATWMMYKCDNFMNCSLCALQQGWPLDSLQCTQSATWLPCYPSAKTSTIRQRHEEASHTPAGHAA